MKGVSFNVKFVKRLKKAAFVKMFAKVYPKLDLDSIYDEIKKSK